MNQDELKSLQQNVSLHRSEGKYKEAIEASYHLLKCGIEVNDYKSMLIAHMNNAASYYCIGDIKEAFHSIEAYDQLCDIYGDDEDYLGLYNVLFL
ncbi:hypothetical protein [Heyndrickxia vini]|uniref:Uncharacterized protein n=1 Tax=Heyndrickxia vini TaxID=1476025 RepID=A0ABX7E4Y6_9BACI|nr:hypothetical protein [Heyndrickxia vini]QQZ10286.1 hypothetical protein I5776_04850 [Heyndrickxia vini]